MNSSTNSELGSHHNINTLIARIKHIGEYIKDNPEKITSERIKTGGGNIYDAIIELQEAIQVIRGNKDDNEKLVNRIKELVYGK